MDERLQRYVQKVLEVERQQRQRALSRSELRELALEVGLSSTDWAAVEQSYQDHLTRGEGFLKYENWSDAIEEFRECQTLFPKDVVSLQRLAEAHAGRWRLQHNEADRKKALDYGQQSLELVPEEDRMLQLVSKLRAAAYTPQKRKGGITQNAKWIAGGGVAVLILLLLLWSTLYQSAPPPEDEESPAFTDQDRDRDLPVSFRNNPETDFVWEKTAADWKRYAVGGATTWTLNGTLVSKKKNTTRLFLKVEALDAEEKIVYSKSIKIADKRHPTIRANDLIRVSYNKYNDPGIDIHALRLRVESVRQQPAPATYAPSPKIDFAWEVPQSSNVSLEIRERYASANTNLGESRFYKTVLEVENTGVLSLKELKLRLRWYVNNELIETNELYVVTVKDPPLRPGQTFVESGTYLLEDIGDKPVRCKIAVASMQHD